jgi:hypothetical protein
VPNPSNPQNSNRFGYVLNNPVNLVDSFGNRSCSTRQANTGDETCWQNIRKRLFEIVTGSHDAVKGVFR